MYGLENFQGLRTGDDEDFPRGQQDCLKRCCHCPWDLALRDMTQSLLKEVRTTHVLHAIPVYITNNRL